MKGHTPVLLVLVYSMSFIIVEGIEYSGPHTPSVKFGGYEHFIPGHLSRIARQNSINTTSEQNTTIQDDHVYYRSVYYPPGDIADSLWRDLTGESDVVTFSLSNGSRLFTLARLPFQFPYYGHLIDTVAVTTRGFLFTGTFYNPRLILQTQTIAPLLANFNPGLNLSASILIRNTSSVFTVQWDSVHNRDHVDAGPFTFQVSLFPTGVIHFAYRDIPLNVSQINNDTHPVEVGLSDSFYIDRAFPNRFGGNLTVRTVYEYNRIRLNASDNLANSAYVLTPLLNCIQARSCSECVQISRNSSFVCGWCDRLQRCSDGIDRHTQEWVQSDCLVSAVTTCSPTQGSPTQGSPTQGSPTQGSLPAGAVVGGVLGGLVLLALLVFIAICVGVVLYGYKHPTSKIGLFMIEHRPKAFSLNKTAASYNVESGKTVLDEKQ